MKVLYFCEGFTDIRFVVGLSERCDLTMVTPEWEFRSSGLAERIDHSGARLTVDEIPGRRAAFQLKSFMYLLRHIRKFDVVLSQGMVRGSLNATLVGKLLRVPVVTYLAIAPVAYWRCRRERGQMGALETMVGEAFIRFCLSVSGRLATTALAMGPFLTQFVGRYSSNPATGYYYGVDVRAFEPIDDEGRLALRRRHALPLDRFLIFFSSRISHEKDPETALRATAMARARGLDAVLLNLGGGFKDFLKLARDLGLQDAEEWVIGRPAVHPMKDLCQYFQAVDLVVQASLAEGSGMSPLEALACGTPVVATNVDGLAVQLKGIAQLTPRRDAEAMADAILWVARNRQLAAEQAMKGREYVHATWRRDKAFSDLMRVLEEAVSSAGVGARASEEEAVSGAGRGAPRLKMDLRSAIEGGHYARKQIFSRDRLVAWSHGRRFEMAVSLARGFKGRRVLDYGCGDGTFLAMTLLTEEAPAVAVGAELSLEMVNECRLRYREEPRLQFVPVDELPSIDHLGRYDAVFCMEVFEHVVDWEPELERLEKVLAPGGKLIISVPVETGLPLVIKQTVRRIAGWRRIGHYPGTSPYSLSEMAASILAGGRQHLKRPVFDSVTGPFHDHKGFNWMVLKERLSRQFVVEGVLASPFSWLGPHLATQAWFICRRPPSFAEHTARALAGPRRSVAEAGRPKGEPEPARRSPKGSG